MLLSKFMYFIHLHHICGINRETGVSQGSRSQSRQDTPSVTAAMSSSFFFLLSFSQSASSSTCLIGFLPNLVRSKYGWMATKLMGLKIHPGSFGVTGVKKMILRKTLLLLQITWYGLVTYLSCNGLTLSTKVMGLKIHPGSFGVTGVKNVNFYCLNDWIRRLTD